MSWTLMPGVRQDHLGRQYQTLVNSRGKQDIRYVHPAAETPRGYTIPLPKPAAVEARRPLQVRASDGSSKRLHVVEWRNNGSKAIFRDFGPTAVMQAFVETDVRCLLRSPDCGGTWIPAVCNITDWHICYHLDEEVV